MKALLASTALLLASCASAPAPAPSTDATSPSASTAMSASEPKPVAAPAPTPPAQPTSPLIPTTPAGLQLAWVLSSVAHPPTAVDAAAHFAPSFLAQVPADKAAGLFAAMNEQLGPLEIDRIEPGAGSTSLAAIVHSSKPEGAAIGKLKVSLRVEDAPPSRMLGLLFRPFNESKPAQSWDEAQAGLRAIAPQVAFLAAKIEGDRCLPISAIDAQKPLALGSAFKLYILATLAKQIREGKHSWEDKIAIEEAKKSLPSGDLRNEPAGKLFTVREMAEQMISVSDNTAADHLLFFAGRKAVEETVAATGHTKPALMVPFLSTRELFVLKLAASPEERTAYLHADTKHRRQFLESLARRDLSKAPLDGWDKPRDIDTLEWFASPEDLCKLMVLLKKEMATAANAPLAKILSKNPGVPDDTGKWQFIGFKGGSEPGVITLAWLLQKKDSATGPGAWMFLAAEFNDTANEVDQGKVINAVTVARDFLAQ